MNFIHFAKYEYDYQFTSQEFGTIASQDVRRFFCLRTFGNYDYLADANQMHCWILKRHFYHTCPIVCQHGLHLQIAASQ